MSLEEQRQTYKNGVWDTYNIQDIYILLVLFFWRTPTSIHPVHFCHSRSWPMITPLDLISWPEIQHSILTTTSHSLARWVLYTHHSPLLSHIKTSYLDQLLLIKPFLYSLPGLPAKTSGPSRSISCHYPQLPCLQSAMFTWPNPNGGSITWATYFPTFRARLFCTAGEKSENHTCWWCPYKMWNIENTFSGSSSSVTDHSFSFSDGESSLTCWGVHPPASFLYIPFISHLNLHLSPEYTPLGHFLFFHLCTCIFPAPSSWTTLTSPMSANTHKHLENAYSFFILSSHFLNDSGQAMLPAGNHPWHLTPDSSLQCPASGHLLTNTYCCGSLSQYLYP